VPSDWTKKVGSGGKTVTFFKKKKIRILEDFRTKLGLVVDQPRSKGSGISNEGSTARTFFNNSELSAKITGLD